MIFISYLASITYQGLNGLNFQVIIGYVTAPFLGFGITMIIDSLIFNSRDTEMAKNINQKSVEEGLNRILINIGEGHYHQIKENLEIY